MKKEVLSFSSTAIPCVLVPKCYGEILCTKYLNRFEICILIIIVQCCSGLRRVMYFVCLIQIHFLNRKVNPSIPNQLPSRFYSFKSGHAQTSVISCIFQNSMNILMVKKEPLKSSSYSSPLWIILLLSGIPTAPFNSWTLDQSP